MPDDADDVVFVREEADAPEVEARTGRGSTPEVEVAEADADRGREPRSSRGGEAADVEAGAPVPREVPGSSADPVSDAAAGPDVAAGASIRHRGCGTGAMTDDPQEQRITTQRCGRWTSIRVHVGAVPVKPTERNEGVR